MDMRYTQVFAISAVMAAGLIFAAREASAQDRPVGGVARNNFHSHSNHFSWEGGHGNMHGRFHGGFGGGGVWIVDREVPVYVEKEVVVREVPVPVAAPAPAPPREAYVIGKTYASLPPQSCMKLIEEGVSYYYCSGEWYRQVGEGRSASYKAIPRKL